MKYLIQFNYSTSQGYRGDEFGDRNQGVVVEAESPSEAARVFNAQRLPGKRFNPFYLKITPDRNEQIRIECERPVPYGC